MKKCLSGEAVNTIKGVDDDFDEMIRRLDNKFGRAEKQSDAIISQLRKLKPVQDGDIRIYRVFRSGRGLLVGREETEA